MSEEVKGGWGPGEISEVEGPEVYGSMVLSMSWDKGTYEGYHRGNEMFGGASGGRMKDINSKGGEEWRC